MTDQDRPKYEIHIGRAQGVVIGDNLRVEQYVHIASPVRPSVSRDEVRILFHRAGSELRAYRNTIANIHIDRAEVAHIVEWALEADSKERLGMLLDQPGSGKTVVMRDVLEQLESEGIPVLAVKADALSSIRLRSDLAERLGLPASVEECIQQVVSEGSVIVLLDQLDALSLTLSRDQATLDVMLSTLARLRELDNVRILASCRTFDLNNDPRLSTIHIDRKFQLQPLDELQVNTILQTTGIATNHLLPEHKKLLTIPLNLEIYVRVVAASTTINTTESFRTLQDLYEALWQKQIGAALLDAPPPTERSDAIYQLVDTMQLNRQLTASVATLDRHPEAARYLERIGFIKREGSNWLFFHQTLFDYCYARRFVAHGHSLSQEILRGPQGFFERSQMVQVLAYLRGTNETPYRRELSALLFAGNLRVHLRLLLIGWLGSLPNPDSKELSIARRLMRTPDDRARFLGAAGGNEIWFVLLNAEILPSLLLTGDDAQLDVVIRYLGASIERRTVHILELLQPFLGRSDAWDTRIAFCLSRLDNWQSEEALDVLCDLLRRGRSAGHGRFILYEMAKSNPKAGCRALRVYLDRRLDDLLAQEQANRQEFAAEIDLNSLITVAFSDHFRWEHELLGEYAIDEIMKRAVEACPEALIDDLLPWFVRVLRIFTRPQARDDYYPSDPVFAYGWFGEHISEGPRFAIRISEALAHLARTQPDRFREIAVALAQIESLAAHRVLARAYLADPESYASDISDYLTTDVRRLDIGDMEESEYDSRRLYGAAFRGVDAQRRVALEQLILSHLPAWEKRELRMRGITQLRFLKSVPLDLLSDNARKIRRELERKFPKLDLHPPQGVTGGWVGPPIEQAAQEKMSDEAWLGAMRTYNDSTGWGAPREHFLKGGVVELSRAFVEQVKANPERFYNLALRFTDDISEYYIAAAISGLSESNAPAKRIFDLTRRYARRFAGEHRRSVIWALEKRSKEGIPDDLLEVLEEWALNDPDPEQESWRIPAPGSGQPYYRGDPHHHGINSNRGAAVNGLCRCALMREPAQSERVFALLECAARDPSAAVRTCVIENLPYLLNYDDEWVLSIFDQAIAGHPDLLRCHVAHRLLYHTYNHHFSRICSYVEQMMAHEDEKTRRYGAVLACLAAFQLPQAQPLAKRAMEGDAVLRQGAAQVYTANLGQAEIDGICLANLECLINDPDESVRKEAGACFAHARSDQIEGLEPFVRLFIDSPSLLAGSQHLIEYLGSLVAENPTLALDATERILNVAGQQVVDIRTSAGLIERNLVQLPLNVYMRSEDDLLRSRAMDLFERLLLMGSHAAHQALQDYDRR